MINHHFDSKSDWVHVPVEKRLPVMLRADMGVGTTFEILQNPDEADELGLLKSALKAGVFLVVDTLKTINVSLGVEVPKFPNGSGARGAIIKVDHARALINFLFKKETQKVRDDLVRSLAPPAKPKKDKASGAKLDEDELLLGMVAQLDPENAMAFDKMSRLAKEKLAERYREQGAERIKSQVRKVLQKEGLDIDFDPETDAAGVKRKAQDADDPQLHYHIFVYRAEIKQSLTLMQHDATSMSEHLI